MSVTVKMTSRPSPRSAPSPRVTVLGGFPVKGLEKIIDFLPGICEGPPKIPLEYRGVLDCHLASEKANTPSLFPTFIQDLPLVSRGSRAGSFKADWLRWTCPSPEWPAHEQMLLEPRAAV